MQEKHVCIYTEWAQTFRSDFGIHIKFNSEQKFSINMGRKMFP